MEDLGERLQLAKVREVVDELDLLVLILLDDFDVRLKLLQMQLLLKHDGQLGEDLGDAHLLRVEIEQLVLSDLHGLLVCALKEVDVTLGFFCS